jgi:hypothetical protein
MELSRLISALSDPSAYPHEADDLVVHQTHISVVFLAGPFAYKVKKPLTLPFLDYGTLEKRRHFCNEELRLNRRLAPEVYLGVIPVTSDGRTVAVEGAGRVGPAPGRTRRRGAWHAGRADRLVSRRGGVGAASLRIRPLRGRLG